MRIALITDGITPYVLGGMQRHSFYLAKYLAQNKIQVDLFHFNQSDFDIKALDCFNDDEKKYITSFVIPFPKIIKFPGHYILESYLYSKKVYVQLMPNIDKYDFIYTKGFTGWKLINVKSKGAKMPPIGINVHGYEMFQKFPNLKAIPSLFLLKMFVKPLLKKSDIVFSYGGKITSLLTDIINIPKEKIIEIPGGIENSWINSNSKSISDKVRFVFLGRAERRKGIEELNEVLRLINTTIDFSFTFIGPIPEHLKINSQKISYLGEIRNTKDLQQVLFDHDVLVCPSHSEGMPNVILEGMANQLAIIATDVGAVNMMVDKENGWLLQGTDTKVLQKTLINVSQMDKSELIKMQKKSLEIVQHKFLWDKIVNFLIDACQLVKK